MKKKTKRQQLETTCENLWKKAVKARDRTCRNCNGTLVLQAHHIRSRRHQNTKYLLHNGLLLCRSCHSLSKFNPEKFNDMIDMVIGASHYNTLRLLSDITVKFTIKELEEIAESLKRELSRMT